MANEISNMLTISCPEQKILNKIKEVLFYNTEENKQEFTLEKFLPRPDGRIGYYGSDWCCAVWGTETDAYFCEIFENENSITICYSTKWSPNRFWVKIFCAFLDEILNFSREEIINETYLEHKYFDFFGYFGGILEWKPFTPPIYKCYDDLLEYARNHDEKLYRSVNEFNQSLMGEGDEDFDEEFEYHDEHEEFDKDSGTFENDFYYLIYG